MAGGEPELVGRTSELQLIEGVLDALDSAPEDGRILEVSGEPGIGKSRLLRELARRADARGHLVFEGRAAEFEGELPFGVVSHALDDWLLELEPALLDELTADIGASLAVVFGALERFADQQPPDLQQERYRAYRAMRLLLTRLAAQRPVVVILDDVQWADAGSVEMLVHLLAHPPRGAVLVALGCRPAQLAVPLERALAAAARDLTATTLNVGPLSAEASRALLATVAPTTAHERLYRESGGNAFFLLQLARGAELEAAAAGADAMEGRVPPPVRASLDSELSALSAPARVLLQGAAVTGDPFDVTLAAWAADLSDADVLLDELVQFGLVHPVAGASDCAFRHPIVRAMVYESAAPSWRARAHARLAAHLAERGAGPSALAPHVERAARRGDAGAVATLTDAGHATLRRAPAHAARWYTAALRLLPQRPEADPERVGLLIALASAHNGSGDLAASRDALVEVLACLGQDDPARVTVVAFCAAVEHLLGQHREAQGRLEAALRAIGDAGSAPAVQLQVELASGAAYENDFAGMIGWAEQAYAGATALGERAIAAVAAGQIAQARFDQGLPAQDALARAAAEFDALSDAELATRLELGVWVGWTEAVMEHHDRAIRDCGRILRVARETGQGAVLLPTFTAQAWAQLRSGRLDDAEETLSAAIDTGRLAPHLFYGVALGFAAVLATYRGDYPSAVRLGEESVALAGSADSGLVSAMSGVFLATPLVELGEAQRARDVLLDAQGRLRTARSGLVPACELLVRADVALGDVESAGRWAQQADEVARDAGFAAESACASRSLATVALARGDAAAAAEIALGGAAKAADAGLPGEAGRCRVIAARGLAAAGERARAVACLEDAVRELDTIGAHGYRDEAERELRRLGRRQARRAPEGGIAALTDREHEIADLVRAGRTNREIAATLFFSEKTVERHLSHIFTKLGVSSRTAVAVVLGEARVPPGRG